MATDIKVTFAKDTSLPAEPVEGRLQIVDGTDTEAYVGTDSEWKKITDADKANVDGFYQDMTVGHALEADQLASDRQIENADEACPPIVFGPVGGTAEVQDGYSKFTELRGNTICWNQLLKNPGFVDETFQWSSYRLTHTESDGICSYLATEASPDMYQSISRIGGHKYLMTARVKLTSATEANPYFKIAFAGSTAYAALNTNWQFLSFIVTAPSSVTSTLDIIDERTSDWDVVQISNVCLFDLTKMFGAGNEPTTVEEFTSQFPNPYYAYNAGQLLSSKSASMILRDRNQFNAEFVKGRTDNGVIGYAADTSSMTITETGVSFVTTQAYRGVVSDEVKIIPSTTYYLGVTGVNSDCRAYIDFYDATHLWISRTNSMTESGTFTTPVDAQYVRVSFQGVYAGSFSVSNLQVYINYDTPGLPYVAYEQQVVTLPNLELKSAGNAYDVAYQEGGGKRRIGSVDLGTLTWSNNGNGQFMTIAYEGSSEIVHPASSNVAGNILCPRYLNVAWNSASGLDKTISLTAGGYIYIQDSAYSSSTTTAFTNSLQGVYLYYELGTETDITTEENPGWTELVKIDNFGTIEFTVDPAQTPQVPQAYFIRYTVNLGEWVDTAYVKTNGDANNIITDTDYATGQKAGVIKTSYVDGIYVDPSDGHAYLWPASTNQLKAGVNGTNPVPSSKTPQAVFYGLSRAAGVNLASSTSETAPDGTNAGIYPADAIQAILKMILPATPTADGSYDLVCTVSSGTPTFSWVART